MRPLPMFAFAFCLACCGAAGSGPQGGDGKWLPGNQFGSLTGTYDRITRNPRGKGRPDDNHLYLWIRLDRDRVYECAINTSRDSQVAVKDLGGVSETPGFKQHTSSYDDLGLRESDFKSAPVRELQDRIEAYARKANSIAAYGTTYPGGEGMHLIHLQDHNANPRYRDKRGQDGMLVFTIAGKRSAMLFKFTNQRIPVE